MGSQGFVIGVAFIIIAAAVIVTESLNVVIEVALTIISAALIVTLSFRLDIVVTFTAIAAAFIVIESRLLPDNAAILAASSCAANTPRSVSMA